MSAMAWFVIAIVAFSLAGVALIVAVFMFIKMNIPSIIGYLTGRTVAKEVKAMKAAHMFPENNGYGKADYGSRSNNVAVNYDNVFNSDKADSIFRQESFKPERKNNIPLSDKPVEAPRIMSTDKLSAEKQSFNTDTGTSELENSAVAQNDYGTSVLNNQTEYNDVGTTKLNEAEYNDVGTTKLNEAEYNDVGTTKLNEAEYNDVGTTRLDEQENATRLLSVDDETKEELYATSVLNNGSQTNGTTVLEGVRGTEKLNNSFEQNISFEITRSILLINTNEEI